MSRSIGLVRGEKGGWRGFDRRRIILVMSGLIVEICFLNEQILVCSKQVSPWRVFRRSLAAHTGRPPILAISGVCGSGNHCINQCTRFWVAVEPSSFPAGLVPPSGVTMVAATSDKRPVGSPALLVAALFPRLAARGSDIRRRETALAGPYTLQRGGIGAFEQKPELF